MLLSGAALTALTHPTTAPAPSFAVAALAAQNPLDPTFITTVGSLSFPQVLSVIAVGLMIVLLIVQWNGIKVTAQVGRMIAVNEQNAKSLETQTKSQRRQTLISSRNAKTLEANTDTQREISNVLKELRDQNAQKLALMKTSASEALAARVAAETLTQHIDDSGLRTLPELVKQHISTQAPVLEKATQALEHVATALTELNTSGAARDAKYEQVLGEVRGELASVRGVLERVALVMPVEKAEGKDDEQN